MPTDTAPELPRETGGFRLLKTLGRGGMGVVYEAEELASGRRVALKVLARELSLSDEAFERFRREARIAASISDSGCVFVFGAHQIDGSPAIAMELCAGETLEHRMRRGDPVPIADAVRWTIEILDGLEAAHQSGIVHRDVKPSNCFITAEGRIKVGDFGLSRSLDEDVQLTQSGVFLGSPLYASPEQIKGRAVDFRSDLYSTGATLYALLAGRAPYRGTNLGEVLARILSEPPEPPSGARKEIPPGLEKVVLRAMARDPAARYQTHAAMREALRPFAASESKAASPLRRLCAYLLDGAVQAVIHMPIIAMWAHFDPNALQPLEAYPNIQIQARSLQLAEVLIGCVYFAVAEGFFRRTVGKWITGQRVVVGSSPGSSLRPFLRALIWTTPAILLSLARFLPAAQSPTIQVILGMGPMGLLCSLALLSTMRRRNGWRGVHEFLSGTRVVAEPLPFARLVARRAAPKSRLEPADLGPARFGNYSVLGRVGKTASGEMFEANDPNLERRVWIHAPSAGVAAMHSSRRSLERPTRLRWLDAIDVDGRRHEVFEAPGGARLLDCSADRVGIDWPTTHRVLSTLAAELEAPDAPRPTLDQLWIDRSWNLRILDEPFGDRSGKREAPLELLEDVLRACTGAERGEVRIPADLPEHAEPAVRSLLALEKPFASVGEVRRALSELAGRPQGLTWKIRGLQMLLSSGLVTLMVVVILISMQFVVRPQLFEVDASRIALRELRHGRALTAGDLVDDEREPTGPQLDEAGLRSRRLLVAAIHDRLPAYGQKLTVKLSAEDLDIVEQAKAELATASPAEIAAARARVTADRPADFDPADLPAVQFLRKVVILWPGLGACVFALFSILLAFAFRGGLSLRLLSIAVRNSRGRKAGRFRCAWRAILTALPFVVLYTAPFAILLSKHTTLAMIALGLAVLAHAGLVFVSLRNPARGWQDRLAGTRLVPR